LTPVGFASAVGSALFSETASNRVFLRSIQDEIDSTVLHLPYGLRRRHVVSWPGLRTRGGDDIVAAVRAAKRGF
jgi:hypothetical protein